MFIGNKDWRKPYQFKSCWSGKTLLCAISYFLRWSYQDWRKWEKSFRQERFLFKVIPVLRFQVIFSFMIFNLQFKPNHIDLRLQICSCLCFWECKLPRKIVDEVLVKNSYLKFEKALNQVLNNHICSFSLFFCILYIEKRWIIL